MTFRRLVQTSGILAFLVLVAALASIACNDSSAPPAPFATLTAPTAAPEETATTTSSPIQAPTAAPAAAPTAEPTAAPAAAPTAEPTVAPAAAPTAEPTVAPAAAPTAEPTTAPAPTATPAPTPAPTPTPAPKPPGYHHGLEHGIAVVQTTRRPSETRDGWVDITLDLAAIKFDGDRGNWEIRTDQKSACFVTSQPSDDCLLIAWGSQEQFEADLRASGYRDERPTLKTLVYPVTFEVAANATVANLFFGDETKIPLNLDGDQPDGQTHGEPVSAPSPPASTARTAGFFMDTDYGVAVTGVRRDRANATRVKVDIAVLSVADSDDLALQIPTESTNGDVCFAGNAGNECLEVTWGAAEEFNARLVVEDSQVAWPQGRGWPTSFEFILPNNVYQATMHFGDHRIPIDSRGMTGQAPVYDYRLHYSELEAGTVLFDFESKMVVLEEVRQEETRDLTLVFKASNDSEAADFSPVVELAGARVTQSGKVVDGQFDDAGWTPLTTQDQGDTIGPGQHTTIELTIPRVVAKPWGFFGGSENPRERPDAALLQLTVSDSLTNAGTMVSGPGFVEFVRTPDELAVWGIWGGKLVWRYGAGSLGSSSSSPTVSGGVVYAGAGYHVNAWDAVTRELVWRSKTGIFVTTPPTVSGGVVYVASSDHYLYALDAITGELVWRYETEGDMNNSPTVSGGLVYVGSDDGFLQSSGGYVYALDAATGELVWRYETGDAAESSPAASGGVVYVASHYGALYALDAATGELVWRYETDFSNREAASSPTVSGGVVYVGLYAVDAATGELVWRYETRAGGRSSPTVSGGIVYVGAGYDVYALDAATGELGWRYRTGDFVTDSSPTVSGGVVYAGSRDEYLYALDTATGELVWRFDTGDGIRSSPTVAGGVVYLGLYAIAAGAPR